MENRIRILFIVLLLCPLFLFAKSKKQVWVIDAGHGGRDVGCEGTKAKEKDINLKIALRVAELVRANLSDVKVVMTRETDKYLTLDQRCVVANNAGADLFLSVHVNSAPEVSNVRGTETYYGPLGGTSSKELETARKRNIQKSELLAWEMQKYYGLAGRPISRGVKRERYYVVLHTKMPSILTEIGFISTPSEQEYMTSKAGQEEIAQCIYRGLRDYKETIEGGREKRVLAEMRRTGGRAAGSVPVGDAQELVNEVLLAQNDSSVADSANGDLALTDNKNKSKISKTSTQSKTTGKTNTGKPSGKNNNVTASNKMSAADSIALAEANAKAEAAVVLDPNLEPELDSAELSFSIQIFALKTKLKDNDTRLKGLKNIHVMEKDGKYKYLYGSTSDYPAARKMLLDVRKVFPDAFLVAFLGQRQISTADAQELYIKKQ